MNRSGRIATLAVLVLVGACASLTKKEPFTTYSPRYTPPPAATTGAPVGWQLSIDTPLASDALDSTRMLVMPSPGALETYKGGRWADTAPLVLRTLRRVLRVTDGADYNLVVRAAALRHWNEPWALWNLEILPRRGGDAGFELSSEMQCVLTSPEEAARLLREA